MDCWKMKDITPEISFAVSFRILAGSSSGSAALVWLMFFNSSIPGCVKRVLSISQWSFVRHYFLLYTLLISAQRELRAFLQDLILAMRLERLGL